MIEWILSQGWVIDFTDNGRAPEGFIEFRRKKPEQVATFWRLSIREAYEFLEGPR